MEAVIFVGGVSLGQPAASIPIAAIVGLVFGLPSLRLRGFYLAVSTLGAQFFMHWLFHSYGWFVNYR